MLHNMAAASISDHNDVMNFPFEFAPVTTSTTFTSHAYKNFLKRFGLYRSGLWHCETIPNSAKRTFGDFTYTENPWVLVEECRIFSKPSQLPEGALESWEDYYTYRGISLRSPVSILLTYPLTLYHIVTSLVDLPNKSELTIHLIGVEKEADLILAFHELCNLLPFERIQVHMIGPKLSASACKEHCYRNLSISLHRNFYHLWYKRTTGITKPDIVVGFNAGLAAYFTFMDTIKLLSQEGMKAVFTDYCRQVYDYTKTQLNACPQLEACLSEATVNPFRSPVRIHCPEEPEPRFSNAIVFELKSLDLE